MTRKCPFSAPLIARLAACRHAEAVVRRGGSEYDCRSDPDRVACVFLLDALKSAALPALGVEDDPTVMPHMVLVKVQCGGLLGLCRLLDESGGPIEDIAALRDRAAVHFGDLAAIPLESLLVDIGAYRSERRGRRANAR